MTATLYLHCFGPKHYEQPTTVAFAFVGVAALLYTPFCDKVSISQYFDAIFFFSAPDAFVYCSGILRAYSINEFYDTWKDLSQPVVFS